MRWVLTEGRASTATRVSQVSAYSPPRRTFPTCMNNELRESEYQSELENGRKRGKRFPPQGERSPPTRTPRRPHLVGKCRDRGKPAVPWTAFAGEDAAADQFGSPFVSRITSSARGSDRPQRGNHRHSRAEDWRAAQVKRPVGLMVISYPNRLCVESEFVWFWETAMRREGGIALWLNAKRVTQV